VRQVAAHRNGRRAPDAGINLVEDQRVGRLGEHQAQRQHRARQLTAAGNAGQRQQR
jgi:hypothetical protein